jgi:hypothetical protein
VKEGSDREELLRRLEQCRRFAAEPRDPQTKERLTALMKDLTEHLEQKKT